MPRIASLLNRVIDVDSQAQTLVPEPEELRQLEIEDRVGLAVHVAWVEQIDGGRRVGGRRQVSRSIPSGPRLHPCTSTSTSRGTRLPVPTESCPS